MSSTRSLRSRLIVGSILWTLGLIVVINKAVPHLAIAFPHSLYIMHWSLVVLGAVVFILAGLSLVRNGMSPINQLRQKLAAVREGRAQRVEGAYPAEVEPLVSDLNDLLASRERQVQRARAKAGDLAHGLKTPLALLAQEAARADAGGHTDLAAAIRQQIDRMQRQMDYHLANAGAAASGATVGARTPLKDAVDGLRRTVQRLHADRNLAIDVNIAESLSVRSEREDVEEVIGNLLDNACKWARTRITVSASAGGGIVTILVDDDGAGLDASMREAVLQRGVRADEAGPGSGFGLAIVRDLVDVYGGSISLETSPLGGLRGRLTLPAA